eukprot:TRINITY_DN6461_c0_g4_i1.p1 TRINITY_DN6461_c0_g4~~TRINITY_DN6461_c0_g4_i1.p1  ORF type:complete len:388 (-),score=74.65 TRINITY_DN6461_c0_g4_i1:1407-2570(-)
MNAADTLMTIAAQWNAERTKLEREIASKQTEIERLQRIVEETVLTHQAQFIDCQRARDEYKTQLDMLRADIKSLAEPVYETAEERKSSKLSLSRTNSRSRYSEADPKLRSSPTFDGPKFNKRSPATPASESAAKRSRTSEKSDNTPIALSSHFQSKRDSSTPAVVRKTPTAAKPVKTERISPTPAIHLDALSSQEEEPPQRPWLTSDVSQDLCPPPKTPVSATPAAAPTPTPITQPQLPMEAEISKSTKTPFQSVKSSRKPRPPLAALNATSSCSTAAVVISVHTAASIPAAAAALPVEDLFLQPKKETPNPFAKTVVRNQAERAAMKGFTCQQCEKFTKAASTGLTHTSAEHLVQEFSRHRCKHNVPVSSTPPGYWQLSFPSSAES